MHYWKVFIERDEENELLANVLAFPLQQNQFIVSCFLSNVCTKNMYDKNQYLTSRASHIICRTQWEMKMQTPCSKRKKNTFISSKISFSICHIFCICYLVTCSFAKELLVGQVQTLIGAHGPALWLGKQGICIWPQTMPRLNGGGGGKEQWLLVGEESILENSPWGCG